MRGGKATHRYVNEQQAQILREAIDNYWLVKKLMPEWEKNPERLIDAVQLPATCPAPTAYRSAAVIAKLICH